MRVLVTGATGFVGTWLTPELKSFGHEVIPAPGPEVLDIADMAAVRALVAAGRPDGVVHLAAVAFAPDAAADAELAIRVNVGGTLAVMEACRLETPSAAVLVIGSSEVYVHPGDDALLTEASPLGPRNVYGLTKIAAEGVALEFADGAGLRVAVARSFNHTGPGQRPVFAVPAFAGRILEARRTGAAHIRAGNVDVARDLTDVRDVVRAYRLLLEAVAGDRLPPGQRVFNVASGVPVTMRTVIDRLSALADWPVEVERDPALVRADDPPVIGASAERLRRLTGWSPMIPFEQTLRDLLERLETAGD